MKTLNHFRERSSENGKDTLKEKAKLFLAKTTEKLGRLFEKEKPEVKLSPQLVSIVEDFSQRPIEDQLKLQQLLGLYVEEPYRFDEYFQEMQDFLGYPYDGEEALDVYHFKNFAPIMQVYKANEANIAKYKESIFPQNSEQELTLEQRKLQEEFFQAEQRAKTDFLNLLP